MNLLEILREQKKSKISGQLYAQTQKELAYNSNRIEGSTLTKEQTSLLYDDGIVSKDGKFNDYVEMRNHFRLFDFMLDTAEEPLTEDLIKKYHKILKSGTEDAELDWFAVGDYKKEPNVIGWDTITSPVDEVPSDMKSLIEHYKVSEFSDIVDFHARFEKIHPFQDGNGRVGRIIMFKECLKNGFTPPIVLDSQRRSYYNGLAAYYEHPQKLIRTMEKFQRQYQKTVDSFVSAKTENSEDAESKQESQHMGADHTLATDIK